MVKMDVIVLQLSDGGVGMQRVDPSVRSFLYCTFLYVEYDNLLIY